ncbi:hypothetical protein NDU88_007535 [Pleurodeles waltl]|uniref:Uncharacterized protein n=1 Tax=Pleurodeles waltl TaxID=8319 RepID=A0AAV7RSP3_PLEWA|nr:hypothetical protein NDU88_007535 [Pleurodeles waltl]
MWSPSLRTPQPSRGAGMDACECSGGARPGSLRPERHNRKPRAPCGAAGKYSSGDLSRGHSHVFEVTGTSDQVDHIHAVTVG